MENAGTGTTRARSNSGSGTFKVLFINNNGGGYAREYDVAPGTTVDQFLADQVRDDPSALQISVNRQAVTAAQILQSGDRITATPVKIAGAYSRR